MPSPIPLSPANRRYGRRLPQPLPEHRMLFFNDAKMVLPSHVDLRSSCGPVKDQGAEGSCTAHAGTSAIEWIFRRYLPTRTPAPILSPQYLYAWELIRQGSFPQDVGSDGVTLSETMIFRGACDISLYPYSAGRITRPTPVQDYNARQHTMGAYHGLEDSKTCISVLGDATPWPVMIGFAVYSSFEGEWKIKGVMPMPGDNETLMGGHEVLAVGYDIALDPVIRPVGCPPSVLCMNSWGDQWGDGGYFWMPIQLLDRGNTDMKIVHAGRPW